MNTDPRFISVIYLGVSDTAKLIEEVENKSPFQVVKTHEQNDGTVAFVFSGFNGDDPEGYFTSFASYFGFPEAEVRVASGNIFG